MVYDVLFVFLCFFVFTLDSCGGLLLHHHGTGGCRPGVAQLRTAPGVRV